MTLTAAGDVASFDEATRRQIISALARTTGVDGSGIFLTIKAASVEVTAMISVMPPMTSASMISTLTVALGSESAASDVLGLTVLPPGPTFVADFMPAPTTPPAATPAPTPYAVGGVGSYPATAAAPTPVPLRSMSAPIATSAPFAAVQPPASFLFGKAKLADRAGPQFAWHLQ